MGVDKTIIKNGNGADIPKKGDTVSMEYTGWLFDATKPDNKGGEKPCVASRSFSFVANELQGSTHLWAAATSTPRLVLAESFEVAVHYYSRSNHDLIVATGWDEGITQMSLGEKATLTISPYVVSR
jgi:hypothetical protein